MRVTITEVKVDKILALHRSFLAKRLFTIRPVASYIGTLVPTFPALQAFGTGQGYGLSGHSGQF